MVTLSRAHRDQAAPDAGGQRHGGAGRTRVDIVIPVYNEVRQLEHAVRTVRAHLDAHVPFESTVTIADNASTDGTWTVAARLAAQVPGVRALHVAQKGRGRALKVAWAASDASVLAYMDVDLATGLDALLPLIAPLVSGHSDLAIGSRLAPGARVQRGAKREIISRGYNLVVRTVLGTGFTDAQCGFKAIRADVAAGLVPLVVDNAWFFDTELLTLAEHNGMRIHEVPVDWVDDPDSRVDILPTAWADLVGTWRLRWRLLGRTWRVERRRRGDRVGPRRATGWAAGAAAASVVLVVTGALAWPLPATAGVAALLASGAALRTLRVVLRRRSRYRRHIRSGLDGR
jgi:glycosyltransferase involved in cell wall biosynthesis